MLSSMIKWFSVLKQQFYTALWVSLNNFCKLTLLNIVLMLILGKAQHILHKLKMLHEIKCTLRSSFVSVIQIFFVNVVFYNNIILFLSYFFSLLFTYKDINALISAGSVMFCKIFGVDGIPLASCFEYSFIPLSADSVINRISCSAIISLTP